ncbi:MAG: polyketide cyclase [Actinobacteria bacterium]|nr:polyketide cyclase [Actinomycetota bacterium]
MTDSETGGATRLETSRHIAAPAGAIFAILCDPHGHVAIDSSGMLQDAEGDRATAAGDSFLIHMDREPLNDYPEMGRYDVTVTIKDFEQDRLISWSVLGRVRPQIGHVFGYRLEPASGAEEDSDGTLVTSYYDWSDIHPDWAAMGIFPVLSESALRATLGILDRTVRHGHPASSWWTTRRTTSSARD